MPSLDRTDIDRLLALWWAPRSDASSRRPSLLPAARYALSKSPGTCTLSEAQLAAAIEAKIENAIISARHRYLMIAENQKERDQYAEMHSLIGRQGERSGLRAVYDRIEHDFGREADKISPDDNEEYAERLQKRMVRKLGEFIELTEQWLAYQEPLAGTNAGNFDFFMPEFVRGMREIWRRCGHEGKLRAPDDLVEFAQRVWLCFELETVPAYASSVSADFQADWMKNRFNQHPDALASEKT